MVNLGGSIIANATFNLTETDTSYDLKLNANVSGFAQLVASGRPRPSSTGTVSADGLQSQSFDLTTHSGGEDFSDTGAVFGRQRQRLHHRPADRQQHQPRAGRAQPAQRRQRHAGDVRAARQQARQIAVRLSRPRLYRHRALRSDFSYAKDDVATSKRTGYQGPVVLCHVNYKPISGHYTTSELTNSLAQNDRILIWYAPLHDRTCSSPTGCCSRPRWAI